MRSPAAPLLLVALLLQPPALSQAAPPVLVARPNEAEARARYTEMVRRVAAMATDGRARQLAARHRLDIMNVLWEDTGRWEGSSVGPNISDVTIEVEMKDSRGHRRTALMPVLRYPNFTDKTGDVAIDRIWIPVGNQVEGGPAHPHQPAGVPRRADPLPHPAGQGEDPRRLAAGQARLPRAGQRAGHLPAHPHVGRGDVLAGDLQLPVDPAEPRRADPADHPPGHQRHRGGQRPGHDQRPELGPAAVLQQGRPANPADRRAAEHGQGQRRDRQW